MDWALIVGSLADGAIGVPSLWSAGADGWMDIGMPEDELLRQILGFLYWLTQLVLYILQQAIPSGCFHNRRLCTLEYD